MNSPAHKYTTMKHLLLIIAGLIIAAHTFAVAPITGVSALCTGDIATLSDASVGGTWSCSSAIAVIGSGTGIITGIGVGTVIVSYTHSSGTAVKYINVNPAAGVFSGPASICLGSGAVFVNLYMPGTWTSSNPAIPIGLTSGSVTATAAGSATITFTNTFGCYSTTPFNVMPLPNVYTVAGGGTYCAGGAGVHIYLSGSDVTASYALYYGTTFYSMMSGTGSALDFGPMTLPGPYEIAATDGLTACLAAMNGTTSVNVVPAIPAITGPASVCAGDTIIISDSVTGGTWTSSNLSVATVIGASGPMSCSIVGLSVGTSVISYVSAALCGTSTATRTITVNPVPSTFYGPSTVCAGSGYTLTNSLTGGVWTSSNPTIAAVGSGSGIVSAVTPGTTSIYYTLPTGCSAFMTAVVNPAMAAIAGPAALCEGTGCSLSDASAGGVWVSSAASVASIGSVSGVVTGVSAGTAIVSYLIPGAAGCIVTTTLTVNATPAITPGTLALCIGGTSTLTTAVSGGTWSSSTTSVATIGSTGVAGSISAGTTTVSYTTLFGCVGTASVTVNPLPTVASSSTPASCGSTYTLNASGGVVYSWSPSTGLSCATCPATTVNPSVTTTYTVTGTSTAGCSNTATLTINGDRILGDIAFTGSSTDTVKVWLVQFNPSDSSITGTDSMLACNAGPTHYYEFTGKPSGDYMVKAQLLSSVAGTSGYMPTYSLASPYWYSAATVTHSGATDVLNVNMLYGTVPSGPGFISGYVYLGAGKGTSGPVGVPGMLIYLQDATGHILTQTFTDASGAYSFTGLAYGDYVISPEQYQYYSIPSDVISLNSTSSGTSEINFKQQAINRTITPIVPSATRVITTNQDIVLYPNPAKSDLNIQWQGQPTGCADLVVSDVVGKEVYKSAININTVSGKTQLNLNGLKTGIYLISVKSDNINYSARLNIQQ